MPDSPWEQADRHMFKINLRKGMLLLQQYNQSPFSSVQFSSVQSLSHVRLFATPWIAARQASLSITNSRSSLRHTSFESVMPSSHLILCRPLLLLAPIPPSIRVFSRVNSSHEVAKVLEFQPQHHSFQRTPRADSVRALNIRWGKGRQRTQKVLLNFWKVQLRGMGFLGDVTL